MSLFTKDSHIKSTSTLEKQQDHSKKSCSGFYYNEMIKFFRPCNITIAPAVVLITMKKLIELSFILNPQNNLYGDNYKAQENRIDFFSEQLNKYFNELNAELISLIVFFAVNIYFILFLTIRYLSYLFSREWQLALFKRILRIIITFYNYGFYQVSLGVSLQYINNQTFDQRTYKHIIGYVNTISTLLVGKSIIFLFFQVQNQYTQQEIQFYLEQIMKSDNKKPNFTIIDNKKQFDNNKISITLSQFIEYRLLNIQSMHLIIFVQLDLIQLEIKNIKYLFQINFIYCIKFSYQKQDWFQFKNLEYFLFKSIFYIFSIVQLGFVVEIHDFSFSFNCTSYLSKPAGFSNLITLIFSTSLVFLNKLISEQICCYFSFIYFSIQIIITFKVDQFLDQKINNINFNLNLIQLLVSMSLLFQIIFQDNSDVIFILIMIIPLSIKIVNTFKLNQYNNMFESFFTEEQHEYSASYFIRIIKIVLKETQDCQNHYMYKGSGVKYENIMHLHRIKCKNNEQCFCLQRKQNKNKQTKLEIEELSEYHNRKEIIQYILLELIQDFIKSKENKKNELDFVFLKFTLINYLHEIINDPTQTCVELYRFFYESAKKNKNLKGIYLFYFYYLKDTILTKNSDYFDDFNLENQRINMMGVVLFDEQIQSCKQKLRKQLYSTGIFYDYLCSNNLNLKYIQVEQQLLQAKKKELESDIIQLYKINSYNDDLEFLTSIFMQILDIENRNISDFQNLALENNKYVKNHSKRFKEQFIDSQKDFFSDNACVIYSSFVEKENKIKKVSVQFKKIFKIHQEKVIGKSINNLLPRIVKEQHDKMIENFVNKESKNIISSGEKFAFGADSSGFAFPIKFRLKLEIMESDIGACVLIQKVQNQNQYILFNDQGMITDYSKKLYIDLYQNQDFKKEHFQDIFSLIPIVQNIIESNQFESYFCSTLIISKHQNGDISEKNTIISSLPANTIHKFYSMNDKIFIIQFKVSRISTKINQNINYIEIEQYEQEILEQKKKRIISEINQSMRINQNQNRRLDKTLNNYSFNFQENSNSYFSNDQSTRKRIGNNIETNFEEEFLNSNNSTLQSPNKKERRGLMKPTLHIQQQKIDFTQNMSCSPIKLENHSIIEQLVGGGSIGNLDILSPHHNQSYNIMIDSSSYLDNTSRTNFESPKKNKEGAFYNINKNNNHLNSITINESNISQAHLNQNQQFQFRNQEDIIDLHQTLQQQKEIIEELNQQNVDNQIIIDQTKSMKKNDVQIRKNKEQLQVNQLISNNTNKKQSKYHGKKQQTLHQLKTQTNLISYDQSEQNDTNTERSKKNEIVSVVSKYSSSVLDQRLIIKIIKKDKISKGQCFMIYTGIMAFLILLFVTIITHRQNIQHLNKYIQSFQQIDNAIYLFMDIFEVINICNFYANISSEKYSVYMGTHEQIAHEFEYQLFDEKRYNYKSHFKDLVLETDNQDILDKLTKEIYSIAKTKDNNGKIDQLVYIDQSLQYTIMEYFYVICQYIDSFTSIEENYIWDNISSFKAGMIELQNIVEDVAFTQFTNMENIQLLIFIIISIINALLVVTIIPLSIQVQVYKENILKLVGSFQPQVLERQIKVIEFALLKLDQTQIRSDGYSNDEHNDLILLKPSSKAKMKEQMKVLSDQLEEQIQGDFQQINHSGKMQLPSNNSQFIPRLPDKRSRQIASFNSLPKFNWIIFLISIISISVLIIQPTINLIKSKSYLEEQKIILNERIIVLDIYSQIIENKTPHYSNINMLMGDKYKGNDTYYYETIQNLTNPNLVIIEKIQTLSLSLETVRFKQNRFNDFYKSILNENVCQVKEKYPSYFKSNISKQICEEIFDGILQRGLLLSFKATFNLFDQIYDSYNDPQTPVSLFNYLKKYSFIEINTFLTLIEQTVDAVKTYQNIQSVEHHEQMSYQFTILFLLQLLIIVIVFAIGWIYLFVNFNTQLIETKNIFTLFHINILFENNFILSYLKTTKVKQTN